MRNELQRGAPPGSTWGPRPIRRDAIRRGRVACDGTGVATTTEAMMHKNVITAAAVGLLLVPKGWALKQVLITIGAFTAGIAAVGAGLMLLDVQRTQNASGETTREPGSLAHGDRDEESRLFALEEERWSRSH
jgi:hypothetical protein